MQNTIVELVLVKKHAQKVYGQCLLGQLLDCIFLKVSRNSLKTTNYINDS